MLAIWIHKPHYSDPTLILNFLSIISWLLLSLMFSCAAFPLIWLALSSIAILPLLIMEGAVAVTVADDDNKWLSLWWRGLTHQMPTVSFQTVTDQVTDCASFYTFAMTGTFNTQQNGNGDNGKHLTSSQNMELELLLNDITDRTASGLLCTCISYLLMCMYSNRFRKLGVPDTTKIPATIHCSWPEKYKKSVYLRVFSMYRYAFAHRYICILYIHIVLSHRLVHSTHEYLYIIYKEQSNNKNTHSIIIISIICRGVWWSMTVPGTRYHTYRCTVDAVTTS